MFRDAVEGVTVLRDYDYFALSRSAETRDVACRFGVRAIGSRRSAQRRCLLARLVARAGAANPRRLIRAIQRRGLASSVALALSVLACYGALAATVLLSLAPITLAINGLLAFAVLVSVAVGAGMRKQYSVGVGLIGFAVLGRRGQLDGRSRAYLKSGCSKLR
jgi:arsenite methyltransferase